MRPTPETINKWLSRIVISEPLRSMLGEPKMTVDSLGWLNQCQLRIETSVRDRASHLPAKILHTQLVDAVQTERDFQAFVRRCLRTALEHEIDESILVIEPGQPPVRVFEPHPPPPPPVWTMVPATNEGVVVGYNMTNSNSAAVLQVPIIRGKWLLDDKFHPGYRQAPQRRRHRGSEMVPNGGARPFGPQTTRRQPPRVLWGQTYRGH